MITILPRSIYSWILPITSLLAAGGLAAENLNDLYAAAKQRDPVISAAKQNLLSVIESRPQARARLLPQINATWNKTFADNSAPLVGDHSTHNYGVTLSQQVFNFRNLVELKQANSTIKSQLSSFAEEEQGVIVRLIERYLGILRAYDELEFARAEKKAFARQLDQISERFNVGLLALTDVHEAQARFDTAKSREIAANTELTNQKDAIREIIGRELKYISLMREDIKLPTPNPNNVTKWVEKSLAQNHTIAAKKYSLDALKHNVRKNSADNYPTLQMDGRVLRTKVPPPTGTTSNTKDLGLTLSVPLFAGGTTKSLTRQAAYDYQAAKAELDELLRVVENDTRRAYRNILTQINQVWALDQVVFSNESALEATQAAYEVGKRTIVDVLNAESELLKAKRDYARSRYDYVDATVKLKQAAGILGDEDIRKLSAWFTSKTNEKRAAKASALNRHKQENSTNNLAIALADKKTKPYRQQLADVNLNYAVPAQVKEKQLKIQQLHAKVKNWEQEHAKLTTVDNRSRDRVVNSATIAQITQNNPANGSMLASKSNKLQQLAAKVMGERKTVLTPEITPDNQGGANRQKIHVAEENVALLTQDTDLTPLPPHPARMDYGIELLASRDQRHTQEFVKQHRLHTAVKEYEIIVGGKPLYILVFGEYQTQQQANDAIQFLQPELQALNPSARNISPLS